MPVNTHNNGARKPFQRQIIAQGIYGELTMTGTLTLTRQSAQWLKLATNGASRNVVLPTCEDGLFFHIVNAASTTENLVVKLPDGSTTLVTINQNEEAIVVGSGTTWKLLRVATIALS